MKRFLALTLALALALTLVTCGAQAANQTATVKGGWLRLRAAPSMDAMVLGSYYTGTQVTVLGTVGAWYHVRTASGMDGYMYGAYLTVGAPAYTTSGDTAYVTSHNGKGVRLRTGPGTAYGVIGLYNVGTKVSILSYGSEWHYIAIGGQRGYMMAAYLTAKPVSVPTAPPVSSGYTAYVTSQNGKSVRLRSGAGTDYDVLGNYPVGTQVTVLNYGSKWSYIRIGNRVGYMMSQFLTTTTVGSTISSVSLNTYSPQVGTRLTASVTPASATVNYQWYDDLGNLLSYASSYTVTSAQVGRRIFVQVYGYGNTSGSKASSYTSPVVSGTPSDGGVTRVYELRSVSISNASPTVGDTLYASVSPNGATASYSWYWENGTPIMTGSAYTVQPNDVGHRIHCVAIGTGNTTGSATSADTDAVKNKVLTYQLTSVGLSNANPKVGDQITATAYPEGSTAAYAWYRENGQLVGSGRSYTVQNADEGFRLYCVATGTGNCTGMVNSPYTANVAVNSARLSGKVTLPNGSVVGMVLQPTVELTVDLNPMMLNYQWYQNGVLVGTGATLVLTQDMAGDDIRLVVQAAPGSGYTGEIGSNYCYVQSGVNAQPY